MTIPSDARSQSGDFPEGIAPAHPLGPRFPTGDDLDRGPAPIGDGDWLPGRLNAFHELGKMRLRVEDPHCFGHEIAPG